MGRFYQGLLIGSTLLFSWLAMQAVHEFGHVLHAWLSGGTVVRVVLHPLDLSRTDVFPNPYPQFVAWGGAVWGCLLPLFVLGLARLARWHAAYLLSFFAGFCLIANGVYLGVGWIDGVGDAGDLLRHGSPTWSLILFGLISAPAGLWFWHGLGTHFGLAGGGGRVDRTAAIGMATLLILTLLVELVLAVDQPLWLR